MPEPPDKPDTHQKTPPTGSARLGSPSQVPQVPTLKTIANQLIGMGGQLHGARNDIDTLLDWQKTAGVDLKAIRLALLGDPKVLHIGGLPSPASLAPPSLAPSASSIPPPAPRPSMAVQAAQAGKKTFQLAPWAVVVLGLLSELAARHTAHGGAFKAIVRFLFPDAQ